MGLESNALRVAISVAVAQQKHFPLPLLKLNNGCPCRYTRFQF